MTENPKIDQKYLATGSLKQQQYKQHCGIEQFLRLDDL